MFVCLCVSVCVRKCLCGYVCAPALNTTVPQVTSSSPEPVMLLISTNSSVPGMIRPATTSLTIVVAGTGTARATGLTEGTIMLV